MTDSSRMRIRLWRPEKKSTCLSVCYWEERRT